MTPAPATRILIVVDNSLNRELATDVRHAQGRAVLQAHMTAQAMSGDDTRARLLAPERRS